MGRQFLQEILPFNMGRSPAIGLNVPSVLSIFSALSTPRPAIIDYSDQTLTSATVLSWLRPQPVYPPQYSLKYQNAP